MPFTYRKNNEACFVIVRHNHEKLAGEGGGYQAGKITDTYDVPLAGATIWVQNAQIGTMSKLNGGLCFTTLR